MKNNQINEFTRVFITAFGEDADFVCGVKEDKDRTVFAVKQISKGSIKNLLSQIDEVKEKHKDKLTYDAVSIEEDDIEVGYIHNKKMSLGELLDMIHDEAIARLNA